MPIDTRAPRDEHPGGGAKSRRPSRQSRRGLDWFTFSVANLQAGFGPFVSVYLTSERWTQIDIGLVLTIGGVAGLLLQAPGGALVDASPSKRAIAALSVVAVGASAAFLASSSHFPVILVAWILHALASCTLTPALSAISLGLVGHEGIAARLGRNASFASFGNALAAAAMGAVGYYVSNQAVFIIAAALMVPALATLRRIRPEEIDPVAASGRGDDPPAAVAGSWRSFLTNRPLRALFGCVLLFYAANAALLPLVGSVLTLRSAESPALLIAACIIVPQVLVTLLSPLVGRLAESWGRRPLLLAAFAVLPLRGVLFGFIQDPHLFVLAQSLEGVSAAILGVLVPLVVADATRETGHFALGQGIVGTGIGIGASVSTLFAGYLADRHGSANAFFGLAAIAALALVLAFITLPETKRGRPGQP